PEGRTHYVAAALPSCRARTDLAMMSPALAGWSVETIGDDVAWLHVGEDGRLWALNPEAGMFGLATGTTPATNPNAVEMLRRDTIFVNVALRDDGAPWWEGMPYDPRHGVLDWRGEAWTPERG